MKRAYNKGKRDHDKGVPRENCPYDNEFALDWYRGWDDAHFATIDFVRPLI